MAQTLDYGIQIFDFATDSTPQFVHGVAGLQDSNMHKLVNEINKLNARLAKQEEMLETLLTKTNQ